MKITIVSPNVSGNCIGRSYMLAKILQKYHEVEIVGPMFGKGVWAPVANDKEVTYNFVKFDGLSVFSISKWKKLYKEIDGDIIYVNKPLLTSMGISVIKKLRTKKPLILDIDDWEVGFLINKIRSKKVMTKLSSFPHSFNVLLGEMLIRFADQLTVSNTFLQNKYGGKIIVHGRNTKDFDPENFDKNKIRDELEIPANSIVVGFIGTPLPYKGIEDLVNAFGSVRSKRAFLLIMGLGSDPYSEYIKGLVEKKVVNNDYKLLGRQPFEKLPEFVIASDIIVIPQRENIATRGQLPAKLFDAMSLEVPVITTEVGDLKVILHKNGWYFKPGNTEELRKRIDHVSDHYDEAKKKAVQSRKDCVQNHSWDSLGVKLEKIIRKL